MTRLVKQRFEPSKEMTPGRAQAVLDAVATGSEDKEACEWAGISVATLRRRQKSDPEFAAAYAEARQTRIEVYRGEARRRALEGWEEPVFFRGQQVGAVRKFSDRMLEVLLRAEDPATFGDRQVVEVLVDPLNANHVKAALQVGRIAGDQPALMAALEAVAGAFAEAAEVVDVDEDGKVIG